MVTISGSTPFHFGFLLLSVDFFIFIFLEFSLINENFIFLIKIKKNTINLTM